MSQVYKTHGNWVCNHLPKEGRVRYRILWPHPGDNRGITHWVYAADRRHKPILYAGSHFAFYNDGRMVEGYQTRKEFE
jgi:hypothetical protein